MAAGGQGANFPLQFTLGAKDKATAELKGVVSRIIGVASALNQVGARMTQFVTNPLKQFGRTSVQTALEVDKSFAHVRAITGITGAAFDKLRDQVGDVAKEAVSGFGDAAKALNVLITEGVSAQKAPTYLKGVIDLAHATSAAADESAQAVMDVLDAFNLADDQIPRVIEVLGKGSKIAQQPLGEFASSLTDIGSTAISVGSSLEDIAAVMQQLALAEQHQPMLALRRLFTELAKFNEAGGTKKTLQGLAQDLVAAGVTPQQMLAAFKGPAGAAMGVLMRAGGGGFAAAQAAFAANDSVATMAKNALAGPTGDLLKFTSAIEALQIKLANGQLLPMLSRMMDIAERAASWFNRLPPGLQTAAVAAITGTALLGPVISTLTAIPRLIAEFQVARGLAQLAMQGGAAAGGSAAAGAAGAAGGGLLARLFGSSAVRIGGGVVAGVQALQTTAGPEPDLFDPRHQAFLQQHYKDMAYEQRARAALDSAGMFSTPVPGTKAGQREVIIRFENAPPGMSVTADPGVDVDPGKAIPTRR